MSWTAGLTAGMVWTLQGIVNALPTCQSLEFAHDLIRFGNLLMYDTIRVGKNCSSWQDLDCYLFTEMLICVKGKKAPQQLQHLDNAERMQPRTRCTLKGSILIQKHLEKVEVMRGEMAL